MDKARTFMVEVTHTKIYRVIVGGDEGSCRIDGEVDEDAVEALIDDHVHLPEFIMSYSYAEQRTHVFTEDGVTMLLQIRDTTKELIAKAGVARCDKMMAKCSGDSWHMLACIDRLVEMGEIHEIPNPMSTAGQHRVFISFDN